MHAHQNGREVLQDQDVDDIVVQEVTKAVLRATLLYQSTKAKGVLATDYCRNSYYEANFLVVQPVEYLYDRVYKSFVYVPVLQMLECLLCCLDVVENYGEEESSFALSLYID